MAKTNHLAVYGTLKREFDLPIMNKLNSALTYERECIIPGKIYDFDRYPALVLGAGKVKAELYKINDLSVLKQLDAYEAVDNEHDKWPGFKRSKIILIEPRISCWVYEYTGSLEGISLVESGEWHV